ncbi:2Fe-2S iron-sulfur cluster-binding protein [Streptomyces pseudovenezuelae]|uniref:Ferredoxin-NADP reductase/predicted pyridoxine 5'-phosphate oxidase superfamily flavin-nucleotide-binding protein n=1 Tax=Streptomyces pseudovenezuelae TaxID=67350 RepID=A0ABT6LNL4_9ACTN|nr:2Fe-2S iron-sulfur cluster-binding protein [Streptomyces pseudovenezuelae]MDH6217905.1 ferredoxin-NADP reductase/predicted pyridoxine 5'-phosphate oxidase superfamily flavin-nucleotide-binding protein [Streptomyces pseudovenezuelae]
MRQADRSSTPHRLTTVDEVETTVGRPASAVMLKQIGALDEGCRTVLARCPIAAFGYRDADGTSRTIFIGGAPGFARVHSPTRISFTLPESGDPHGPVSFFFLLPGVGEILRVNGSVAARKGARTTVDITEAYVHCAQAVLRARLWQPPASPEPAAEFVGDGPLRRPGVADFLAAAPFLALSTWDSAGGSDTSPRGDRQTVARILDGHTLVIPDRKGNKRADTLHNLLRDDRLSFAALVPGRSGVLHVRGRGAITDDPALLETMALRGMPPHLALLIDVEHAEVTGNDAVARSRLWTPGAHLDRGAMPDLLALAGEHLAAGSAEAEGGPPAFLLKLVGAIPGVNRLLRLAADRLYRSGLRKEGYEDVESGAGGRRRGFRRRDPADYGRTDTPERAHREEHLLREVRIAEVRSETPSAVTLVLEDADGSPGPFDFRPGQFFTLVADIEGRPVRRAYSASSAPGSSRLEVTVKHVEDGRFSTHVHRSLRAGDRLAVRGPSGSFHAEPQPPDEIVLVAAGSGVTPMMSMIRARLADRPGGGRIALLYSSRRADEIIFADELTRLTKDHPDRLSITHVLTGRDGRLDADGVRRWVTGLSPARDAHYYVCGPAPLMDAVQGAVTGLGVPQNRVHQERFTSGADTGTAPTVPQEMTVEEDGRPVGTVVVEPGQTLLDAGLAAGLPMPYSCTVGNCGDCRVLLRTGEVAQNEPNCLTPEQKADGYVLTCVGCPLSKVTLDIADP